MNATFKLFVVSAFAAVTTMPVYAGVGETFDRSSRPSSEVVSSRPSGGGRGNAGASGRTEALANRDPGRNEHGRRSDPIGSSGSRGDGNNGGSRSSSGGAAGRSSAGDRGGPRGGKDNH